MRLWGFAAFLYLFVAGATATVAKLELEIGDSITFMVQTLPHTVDGCFISTPQNKTIEFKPNDGSIQKRYELLPDKLLTGCQVKLYIVDDNDKGLWSIYFTENNSVIDVQEYEITVKSSEVTTTEGLPEELLKDTTWLKPIDHVVAPGMTVEISLKKSDDATGCSLQTPSNSFIYQSDEYSGITFFETNSEPYTSCRVQIGPFDDDSLLGDWILCRGRVDNDLAKECQTSHISWNNNNRESHWEKNIQTKFDHPVHYGGKLTLTVLHSGTIKSCHIITPTGNDLALTEDSNFPYVTRIAPFSSCVVVINTIDSHCLGDWTIYGIYTGLIGVTEVRLPTSLFLYDEKNPFEQAYNVTKPSPIVKVVNILNTIELEVSGKGDLNSCDIIPPENADIENDVVSIDSIESCKYSIGPISENMLGDWLITGKFSSKDLYTEIRQVFTIKQEDPYNPELDENRVIRYLEPKIFETSLGATHEILISGDTFRIIESCHIRTPDGRQYSVIEGFHLTGVDAEKNNDCALNISIASEDMIGVWTLIARKLDFGLPVEERLNFTIYIEEQVEAVPSQVNIFESQDLVIRLRDKTNIFETCKLYSPQGEYLNYEVNTQYYDYCGFIVRNVDAAMNGMWQIIYGDGIMYKASIAVNIVRRDSIDFSDHTWIIDDKVDLKIGPDDVAYCQVKDSSDEIVFDDFGQCRVPVGRVGLKHEGKWSVLVGHQGKILMEEYWFNVVVKTPSEDKPVVKTQVQIQASPLRISLLCSVQTPNEVQLCKFRNPSGEVLIASDGVAQGRYMALGSGSNYINGLYHHECGIRITDAALSDGGIWRCAINTASDTHYGFLTVKDDSIYSKVVAEPQLVPSKTFVKAVVGDNVTISCNIQTKISYCYFRMEDGTIYNLVPGVASEVQYHGAGFDAGDCGIQFNVRSVRDSGNWICNVGIDDQPERKQDITLQVYDELTLQQWLSNSVMVLRATAMQHHGVDDTPKIDHCRYVRRDGKLAFTTSSSPVGYSTTVSGNVCELRVSRPTIADYNPWTVIVKLQGRSRELTGVSTESYRYYYYYSWNGSVFWLWLSVTIMCLSITLLACSLGPKKNRDWTFERARSFRNSIRSSMKTSFRKPPLALPSILDDKPPAYSA